MERHVVKLHQNISCPVDVGGKQVSFIVSLQRAMQNKSGKLPIPSDLSIGTETQISSLLKRTRSVSQEF